MPYGICEMALLSGLNIVRQVRTRLYCGYYTYTNVLTWISNRNSECYLDAVAPSQQDQTAYSISLKATQYNVREIYI